MIARKELPLVKVTFKDLQRMGVVRDRLDLHNKIQAGKLRRPCKDGPTMQSAAWWWWDDIVEDLERERNQEVAKRIR